MKILMLITVMLTTCYCSFGQSDMLLRHNDKGNYIDHRVQAKENFYSVGRLYNISPKDIAAFNNIDMEKGLNKDQVLHIPLVSGNFSQGVNAGSPVYVKAGDKDDLKRVGSANKVSVENIRRWNSLTSDKVAPGTRLVVGFLISKELAAKTNSKKDLSTAEKKSKTEQETVIKKEDPLAKKTEPQAEKEDPQVNKAEPLSKKEDPQVNKTEPLSKKEDPVVKKENIEAVPKNNNPEIASTTPVPGKETNTVIKPVNEGSARTNEETTIPGEGYFKSTFDQQVKSYPANRNETLVSGIFKTASGWQDAKYYLLIDGVQPGMVVKVVNPNNNRVVYAKVLGEMSGIRQNEGLNIRLSNSAASVLEVADQEKFTVKVNY